MNGMMSGGQMMGGYMGAIPMLPMIIVTIILITALVWIISSIANRRADDLRPSAIEILDENLASGNISKEEYSNRRDLLES